MYALFLKIIEKRKLFSARTSSRVHHSEVRRDSIKVQYANKNMVSSILKPYFHFKVIFGLWSIYLGVFLSQIWRQKVSNGKKYYKKNRPNQIYTIIRPCNYSRIQNNIIVTPQH